MKILYVTTIGATMGFFVNFIDELIAHGHTVDIATNDSIKKVPDCYLEMGCRVFSLSCSRTPLSKGNLRAYKQLKSVIENENYDIVHCHTPIASAITRLVCRKFRKKAGLKVFYTAHGFHFYKGAPKLNWMVYYPIEKFCSRYTDKLITINKEDYELAKTKFNAKEVRYVPGVGIDLSRFENLQVDREAKRREMGVPDDAFLLLSVGELNENKNHQIIIRALAKLNNPQVHYAIAGVGDKKENLLTLANELGVYDQLHLLEYRKDVVELYKSSEVFVFPSFREGLSVALMEAMACGLPVVCSKIRGNTDLIDERGGVLFDPTSPEECHKSVLAILNCDCRTMGEYNKLWVKKYSVESVLSEMKSIYDGVVGAV